MAVSVTQTLFSCSLTVSRPVHMHGAARIENVGEMCGDILKKIDVVFRFTFVGVFFKTVAKQLQTQL